MKIVQKCSFFGFSLLFFLLLWVSGAVSAPVNDNFSAAAAISGGIGKMVTSNVDATSEVGEPNHEGAGGSAFSSIWFSWTAPFSGYIIFNTFGSDFDTSLAAYTGTAVNSLTNLDANDDGLNNQSRINFQVVSGTTYYIAVDGDSSTQVGDVVLNWQPTPPLAANDIFANASVITENTGTVYTHNFNTTAEVGEPNHGDGEPSAFSSIWFSWTAPFSGSVLFDTAGSDYETVLAVYTGTAVNSLTKLAEDENEILRIHSRVYFSATAGSTYYIAVDGDRGEQGYVTLNWETGMEPVENDNLTNATHFSGESGQIDGHNFDATAEAGEPNHGDGDPNAYASVWFDWTAPFSGTVIFDTFGSDFDTTLAAYTGSAVSSLTKLVENDDDGLNYQSRISFTAVSGTTYHIAVDGYEGYNGFIVLHWAPMPAAPENDNFANATVVEGERGSAVASNFNATAETGEPNHGDGDPTAYSSIWFSWTAPFSEQIYFDTLGSDFDTVMAAYTGTVVNSLTLVVDNDDARSGQYQSRIGFMAIAGTTYHIAVDGYEGSYGNVNLHWNSSLTPLNDNFVDATVLPGVTGMVNSYNYNATAEMGEPNHGDGDPSAYSSIWFSWTATLPGQVVFDTLGSNFDTVMAAYTGTAIGSLMKLVENNNDGERSSSRINFSVKGGTTYYVAIDGLSGTKGDAVLNYEFTRKKFPWSTIVPVYRNVPDQNRDIGE